MLQQLMPQTMIQPSEQLNTSLDPDVVELCDHFHIEDPKVRRLNDLMKNRPDTFRSDLAKLWDTLEEARNPTALLVVKMKEMEDGSFRGKNMDTHLAQMA